MKNFIQKKNELNESEIKELLYYYKQGIIMGKEEMLLTILNNLVKYHFDLNMISKITNKTKKEILNYLK